MRRISCPYCSSTDTRPDYRQVWIWSGVLFVLMIGYIALRGLDLTVVIFIVVASAVITNPASICNSCGKHYV